MIRVSIKTTRKKGKGGGFERIIRNVEQMAEGPSGIIAGLPTGKADQTVIEYATYNHFGTAHIDSRPFMTIAIFKNRAAIRASVKSVVFEAIHGMADLKQGLGLIGVDIQGMIQDQIKTNMPPELKPATIKAKGSSSTLIDSARMFQSITWDYIND